MCIAVGLTLLLVEEGVKFFLRQRDEGSGSSQQSSAAQVPRPVSTG
jgi:hypothetical protein